MSQQTDQPTEPTPLLHSKVHARNASSITKSSQSSGSRSSTSKRHGQSPVASRKLSESNTGSNTGKKRPSLAWKRSISEPVATLRTHRTTSPSRDDTSSILSYFSRPQAVETPVRPLTPLRPPDLPSPLVHIPTEKLRVKIETPFSESPMGSTPAEQITQHGKKGKKASGSSSSEYRKSSLNPLKLFATPFVNIRHASPTSPGSPRPKRPELAKIGRRLSGMLSPTTKAHRTLTKRDEIKAVLDRVSTLLEYQAQKPLKNHASSGKRNGSDKAGRGLFTRKSSNGYHAKVGGQHSAGSSTKDPTGEDVGEVLSYTSSLLDLKMGAQPDNTPEGLGTYRVKRSASAESEEFLKIDISVRGGTSYLPSEARRVHTPPLPGDAQHKHRGFFFDYYPEHATKSRQASSGDDIGRIKCNAVVTRRQGPSSPRTQSNNSSSKQPDSARISTLQPPNEEAGHGYGNGLDQAERQCPTPAALGDWYDIALAQLETPRTGRSGPNTPTANLAWGKSDRNEHCARLSEIKKMRREEMLDYNVPEHLPSSPLCPRHPRYWRVVQGRGSQFRGCWMHGFGVYGQEKRRISQS